MDKKKILIVEDEKDIARLIQYNLDKAGYVCETAVSGEAGLSLLDKHPFDLVILDVMLPGVDGLDVCRRIKQNPELRHIPVMMLTAKGEEVDRIVGLELGADDYVVKPFSPRELTLRIKAVLRRSKSVTDQDDEDVLKAGALVLDRQKHRVTANGKDVVLTAMEFKLLAILMERRGRVQNRDKLLNDVWGIEADVYTRTIDTHVRRLRSKLGNCGDLIETVVGVGYRFRQDDDEG
ncbi:MAG: response regulator transcription factor [Candidatus Omnitrophota bacterium]